ncbi:MAG TPA: hypothetical protein PKX86_07525 [Bacteroidia bacterium]|nr:hypothetical protein [Bacteroidia bacterium]
MNFDNLTTALLIIAPTFIVAGGMYMLIKNMLERDYRLKLLDARRLIQKDMLPLKLQAVERMVVFLERIQPENILFRILQPGMNVRDLQVDLLAAIRQEYEHNVSQQVYVSVQSWSLITKAKHNCNSKSCRRFFGQDRKGNCAESNYFATFISRQQFCRGGNFITQE